MVLGVSRTVAEDLMVVGVLTALDGRPARTAEGVHIEGVRERAPFRSARRSFTFRMWDSVLSA